MRHPSCVDRSQVSLNCSQSLLLKVVIDCSLTILFTLQEGDDDDDNSNNNNNSVDPLFNEVSRLQGKLGSGAIGLHFV